MNCPETTRLLNPYVDGELDLCTALAIEEHIQACARCRASFEGLLRGARDESGGVYEAAVKTLVRRGVEFRVCNNTLARRNIASSEVIPAATLVPSGVAEIGRLQSREGFIYLRL